jgi:hypothetical protein
MMWWDVASWPSATFASRPLLKQDRAHWRGRLGLSDSVNCSVI